ncbi:MAG: hypothetical protein KBF75_10700 [Saprospiraceae bacterium]|jgi:hypothetical protein|nr:hypothetical protein [Saprospiraceae bacterium]
MQYKIISFLYLGIAMKGQATKLDVSKPPCDQGLQPFYRKARQLTNDVGILNNIPCKE